MASIYIYNRSRGKCVELNSSQIGEEDIHQLKSALPENLEGIYFKTPFESEEEETASEVRVEDREGRVAEYLKNIGNKLEELQQLPGALRFYDLSFRLSKNSEIIMMKARALSQHGHVDRAELLLKKYVEANPESPQAYFMFGKLALSRADYSEAQRFFLEAQKRIRASNVEHKPLKEILDSYDRFVGIYLDRDQLFTRDLPHDSCIREIKGLRQRTQILIQEIGGNPKSELQGMIFFLETQDKIFERWLEEMGACDSNG